MEHIKSYIIEKMQEYRDEIVKSMHDEKSRNCYALSCKIKECEELMKYINSQNSDIDVMEFESYMRERYVNMYRLASDAEDIQTLKMYNTRCDMLNEFHIDLYATVLFEK